MMIQKREQESYLPIALALWYGTCVYHTYVDLRRTLNNRSIVQIIIESRVAESRSIGIWQYHVRPSDFLLERSAKECDLSLIRSRMSPRYLQKTWHRADLALQSTSFKQVRLIPNLWLKLTAAEQTQIQNDALEDVRSTASARLGSNNRPRGHTDKWRQL